MNVRDLIEELKKQIGRNVDWETDVMVNTGDDDEEIDHISFWQDPNFSDIRYIVTHTLSF